MVDSSTLLPTRGTKSHGTSAVATIFSVLQLMAGTGILGLPQATATGGWVSLSIMVLVGLMANYTAKALIATLYSLPKRAEHRTLADLYGGRLPDYPSVGAAAFGTAGRCVVHIFHKATLFGVSCIFLILAGAFLVEGIGGGGEGFAGAGFTGGEKAWTQRWTAIGAVIALVPLVGLRTLREVAPLAALGLLGSTLTIGLVVVESAILYPVTNHTHAGGADGLPTSVPLTFATDGSVDHAAFLPAGFANAFSTITLSFGGHAVLPSIEAQMVRPQQFPMVANVAFVVLLGLYLVTSVAGYFVFGAGVASPVLCSFPRDASTPLGFAATATKLIIALHVITTVPLLLNPFALELERGLGIESERKPSHVVGRSLVRTSLLGAALAVALAVPYFGDAMSFVGAACLTMMVFVLPVLLSWRLRPEEIGTLERLWGGLILLTGCTAGAVGTYQALVSIVQKLENGN